MKNIARNIVTVYLVDFYLLQSAFVASVRIVVHTHFTSTLLADERRSTF